MLYGKRIKDGHGAPTLTFPFDAPALAPGFEVTVDGRCHIHAFA